MRGSNLLILAAVSVAILWEAGCSPRTVVAVDPYPDSGDGGTFPPSLLDGVIGYWHLDDASGSATARDWSGWSNDGTLVGLDPTMAWVPDGPGGGALSVQSKGHVEVVPSASIDSITDQVTVAAWIFLQGTIPDYATAISRQIGAGYGQHYHLSVNAQQLAALFITTTTDGQVLLLSPSTVPQQTWIHIAGTYDGAQARLYVNGAEVVSKPVSGPFATETNPLILAGNGNGTTRTVSESVPGQLAQIMLYRRALGADEIARLESGALFPSTGSSPDGGP